MTDRKTLGRGAMAWKEFKRRWQRINVLEANWLHNLTMKQKLCQLASITRIGRALRLNFGEDAEKLKVRSRWVFLKKAVR